MRRFLPVLAVALASATVADACLLCGGFANSQPLREDAKQARIVLFGTLADAKPTANGGTTDLRIEAVIKSDPAIAGKSVVTLPKYVPFDPKEPPRYLVFCDVFKDRLDPYRGFPVKSTAVVEYLKKALTLKADDAMASLKFYSEFLNDAEPEIANDAYLEWARANDRDVTKAAKQLDPARLRTLLRDPKTTDNKLSLFAYLLGSCGGPHDADYLLDILNNPSDRNQRAFGGALAGYMQMRPVPGWKLAREIVADAKRSFPQRMAVLTTMRFLKASQPESARANVLKTLAISLKDGTIADLPVEDLRQWEWWDLTADVLAQYGKMTHNSPMIRRAIIRYAVCCPKPEAKSFVDRVRKADAETVQDIEEQVAAEKAPVSGRR